MNKEYLDTSKEYLELDEYYEKQNKMYWVFMLFQLAIIVLSVSVLFLSLHEVPCLR